VLPLDAAAPVLNPNSNYNHRLVVGGTDANVATWLAMLDRVIHRVDDRLLEKVVGRRCRQVRRALQADFDVLVGGPLFAHFDRREEAKWKRFS
jgi:hypothetical protein